MKEGGEGFFVFSRTRRPRLTDFVLVKEIDRKIIAYAHEIGCLWVISLVVSLEIASLTETARLGDLDTVLRMLKKGIHVDYENEVSDIMA